MTQRDINNRSNEIFKHLVEAYVETGEPVGSRTLSRMLSQSLSPATIRNIMADLEDAGLLYSPHTSAGRLPTEHGLRYFVNGLLEVGDLKDFEKRQIDDLFKGTSSNLDDLLEKATQMLSGLAHCAGVVMSPKSDATLSHIEFVYLSKDRALVVLVDQNEMIENRIIHIPEHVTHATLSKASQYLNQYVFGKTLNEVLEIITQQKQNDQSQLDVLTSKVVEAGLAVWSGHDEIKDKGSLIVRGQSNLLNSIQEMQDLENIRSLFNALDAKESISTLLNSTLNAEGIQIFIGSESSFFSNSGCSMVIAPYQNSKQKIIGAIGVVGPSRMNYGRIIPLVDYTAKIISKLM
ncbi:MAG: heat-inducible transcriptional repressor HrcA [Proteobacteria bacterium]|nr:heat-inducible transcriptional repressor HrcA [Pseudomonadota bacterium]